MIYISLVELRDNTCYFFLRQIGELNISYNSCGKIANFLNLSIEKYNDILFEKVIKHNNYEAYTCESNNGNKNIDVVFFLNSDTKETYIERFKEAFAPQLTLLAIGDGKQ